MSRNNLLTVTITVSELEGSEMPIQVDVSESIEMKQLETLFERVLETCRMNNPNIRVIPND